MDRFNYTIDIRTLSLATFFLHLLNLIPWSGWVVKESIVEEKDPFSIWVTVLQRCFPESASGKIRGMNISPPIILACYPSAGSYCYLH